MDVVTGKKPVGRPFQKGQKRPPGAGRKKGSPNHITTDMRKAVLAAFEALGAENFFVKLGKGGDSNKRALVTLFSKMIPIEVLGMGGSPDETAQRVRERLKQMEEAGG